MILWYQWCRQSCCHHSLQNLQFCTMYLKIHVKIQIGKEYSVDHIPIIQCKPQFLNVHSWSKITAKHLAVASFFLWKCFEMVVDKCLLLSTCLIVLLLLLTEKQLECCNEFSSVLILCLVVIVLSTWNNSQFRKCSRKEMPNMRGIVQTIFMMITNRPGAPLANWFHVEDNHYHGCVYILYSVSTVLSRL